MASKKRKGPTPPRVAGKASPATVRAPARTGPTRKELQREAARKRDRREARRRTLIAGGLVVAGVAAVAAYVVVDRRNDAELREALTAGTCSLDTETDPTAAAGRNHVPSPSYAVDPPAGGDHLASAARAGVYSGTSVPTDGALVHSLEHGYVIAWHQPDLPAEQQDQLADFAAEHRGDVIVAERAGMDVPVAATAWGQRLLCEQVEPEALERFFEERVGDGPEDVPRG